MSVLDLIKEEIDSKYPLTNSQDVREYEIRCSKSFSKAIHKSFLDIGFFIPATIDGFIDDIQPTKSLSEEPKYIRYQIAPIGALTVIIDREQGYEIKSLI